MMLNSDQVLASQVWLKLYFNIRKKIHKTAENWGEQVQWNQIRHLHHRPYVHFNLKSALNLNPGSLLYRMRLIT